MAKIKLPPNLNDVPDEPPSSSMRRERVPSRAAKNRNGTKKVKRPKKPPEPGSFAARVGARRVDLLRLIDEGLPPIEYLPASDGMLVRGKRHQIAAPMKTGKSLGTEVHAVDMCLAGARVVILDRENGQDEYARRLADIIEERKLNKKQREAVRRRLRYYEFPELRRDDAEELVELLADADLVVFDAQRMFLSDFGLKESEADDYASFMSYAVDPLFRAGVATLILDNTGHGEKTRSRGSSAKGDLNEVLFSMETLAEFDKYRRGRLSLKVERSRFGNVGEWTMEIGGGALGPWRQAEQRDRPDFRAYVMEALADGKTIGGDRLAQDARKKGITIKTAMARTLLKQYAAEESSPVIRTDDGYQLREHK